VTRLRKMMLEELQRRSFRRDEHIGSCDDMKRSSPDALRAKNISRWKAAPEGNQQLG
jgi:hypothetical protein